MDGQNRRAYQRGGHFSTEAMISHDGKAWKEAEINDLSLSGLQLCTDEVFEVGNIVSFYMVIQGFFTEFEVKVKGAVRRVILKDGKRIYGVSFIDLSDELKVMIDENVRRDRPVSENPYSLD